MADPLTNALNYLDSLGFYDTILPYLLVFTVVFAILQRLKIFRLPDGKPNKAINGSIAFVLAFIFITSVTSVQILSNSLEKIGLAMVVIVAILMLTGFLVKDFNFSEKKWLPLAVLVVVLVIFGTSIGIFRYLDNRFIWSWITSPILWAVIIFLLIVWYITRTPSGDESPSREPSRPSGGPRRPANIYPGSERVRTITPEEREAAEEGVNLFSR